MASFIVKTGDKVLNYNNKVARLIQPINVTDMITSSSSTSGTSYKKWCYDFGRYIDIDRVVYDNYVQSYYGGYTRNYETYLFNSTSMCWTHSSSYPYLNYAIYNTSSSSHSFHVDWSGTTYIRYMTIMCWEDNIYAGASTLSNLQVWA